MSTASNLSQLASFKMKTASGFETEVTVYECESCTGCPHKKKCTKAKGNRQMRVSKTLIAKCAQFLENIATEEGAILRMNRS